MICGGGGDLKCPANNNQNNGLEVYSRFLQTVAGFQDLESLPASVKFNEEHDAEIFLKNQAKWHKTCRSLPLRSYFDCKKESSVVNQLVNSRKGNRSDKGHPTTLTRKAVFFALR